MGARLAAPANLGEGCQDAGVGTSALGGDFLFVSFPSPGSDSLLSENPLAE